MAHADRENADDALALALAAGRTLRDAAADAGIGERTAHRRWADPAFRRRVAELRAEMVGRALGRTADSMAEAANVLRALLAEGQPPAVRLGAARSLLEFGSRCNPPVEQEADDHAPMDTAAVVKLLAGRLRRIDAADELSAAEKARLTATLADTLLRAIGESFGRVPDQRCRMHF